MSHFLNSMVSLAHYLIHASSDERRVVGQAGLTLESLEGRKLLSGGMHRFSRSMGGGSAQVSSSSGHGHYGSVRGIHSQTATTTSATTTTPATTTSATTPTTTGAAVIPTTTASAVVTSTSTASSSGSPSGPGASGFSGGRFSGGGFGMMGYGGNGLGGRHGGYGHDSMSGNQAQNQGSTSTTSTQLQTDITKYQTDQQAIHDKSQVTPAMMATVRNDWKAISTANPNLDLKTLMNPQPSTSTITSTSIATSPATPVTPPTFEQRISTLQTASANAKVSQTLIDPLVTDMTTVNTASGVTAADITTLQADHAAIQADGGLQGGNHGPINDGSGSVRTRQSHGGSNMWM